MKIAYISDLHCEHNELKKPFQIDKDTDVIFLLGDIHHYKHVISCIEQNFPSDIPIVYVTGNHEYYGSDYDIANNYIKEKAEASSHQIKFLNNGIFEINGYTIIGSTLFTDFEIEGIGNKYQAMKFCQEHVKDFKVIEYKGKAITPENFVELFDQSFGFINNIYDLFDEDKIIIATHYAPSYQSIAPEYMNSLSNVAFASELSNWIAYKERVVAWLHGHVHNEVDKKINETHLLCNPRGYKDVEPIIKYKEL